jgi:hypothetical protein
MRDSTPPEASAHVSARPAPVPQVAVCKLAYALIPGGWKAVRSSSTTY